MHEAGLVEPRHLRAEEAEEPPLGPPRLGIAGRIDAADGLREIPADRVLAPLDAALDGRGGGP